MDLNVPCAGLQGPTTTKTYKSKSVQIQTVPGIQKGCALEPIANGRKLSKPSMPNCTQQKSEEIESHMQVLALRVRGLPSVGVRLRSEEAL